MPAEHQQPRDGGHRQRDREADERRPDEPGNGLGDRVAGRHDQRDQTPDDDGRAEDRQVHQSVAGLHDERV